MTDIDGAQTSFPAHLLLDPYRRMTLIRVVEERLAEDRANGKLPGPVHLYIGREAVAVGFSGDGAANQGVLMEALNVASLWRLPQVLVCESNGFSEFSRTDTVGSGRKQIGDEVKEGEILYAVETEKVTSEIPSPATGRLVEILVEAGFDLAVGDPVCRLEI